MSTETKLWLIIGGFGQAIFTARFLVQWVASEKKRDTVVPIAFWWLSLVGGMTLLTYAVHREDPVIIIGQGMGVFIYVRNLTIAGKAKKRKVKRSRSSAHPQAIPQPHWNHRPASAPHNASSDPGPTAGISS